jgi:WD40 repeat protein
MSSGGGVRIWDVATGDTLGSFVHPRAVRAAFAPGGARVLSLAIDGTCRIWTPTAAPPGLQEVGAHAMSGDARLVLTLTATEARVWLADSGARIATIAVAAVDLTFVGFSPDGRRILAIARDGTAQVWASETGEPVARLDRAFPEARLLRFSPDGRSVFAISRGAATIWNLESGRVVPLDGILSAARSVSFSPDGARVLALTDDSVVVWESASGRSRILCGPDPGETVRRDGPRPEASFTQDSQRVVGASCDGTGHVWNADTGEELAILSGHSGDVRFVSASPDGSVVVTGSSSGILTLWDTATWAQVAMLRGHSGEVRHVSFSASGDRLVTASVDRTARIWDPRMAFGAPTLEGHQGSVSDVRFSADGKLALTSSTDGWPRVWDLRTCRVTSRLAAKRGLESPEFSPDGKRIIALYDDGTAVLFECPGGTLIAVLGVESSSCNAAFASDGSRIVTASDDGTAHVFDARDGSLVAELVGHEGSVHFVAFCARDSRVVTASEDHTVRLWDASTGNAVAQTPGHGSRPPVVSPDGTRIAVTLVRGEIRVYETVAGREVATLPGSGHGAAIFSPDGRRLATEDADGNFRLWDRETGTQLTVLHHEEGSRLHGFSPDGTRLVTTTKDGAAQLWDVGQGRRVAMMTGQGGAVTDATFSPDGSWIVISSADETRIFDARSATEAWVMTRRHGSVRAICFSPDGSRLLAGYGGGVARIWPSDPLASARRLKPRELTLQEIAKHGTEAPEAVRGVMRLFEDALTNEEIVDTIGRRANLSDALRTAATKAASTRNPHVVAEKLRRRSWAVVSRPNADPELYATALKWIEVALKLSPGVEDGVATLGAARFRAGMYRRALENLGEAVRKATDAPRSYGRVRNSLFIAMTHSKLGEDAQAAMALSDARRTLAELGQSPPEEIRRLLVEADLMIAGPEDRSQASGNGR